MKKLFFGLAIGILISLSITTFAGLTGPSGGGSPATPDALCKIDDDTWILCNASDTFGDATNPIGAIDVDTLTVNTVFNLGGIVGTGGLDLNGEILILDADADTSITADTDDQIDFELGGADIFTLGFQTASTLINSIDTSTALTIQNTDTAIGTAGYLLELIHDSNNDADADFLICKDDGAGTPDTVFSIAHDGSIVVGGSLTSTFTDSVSIGSGTASTVDMGAGAAADLYVTDDHEIDGALYVGGITTASDAIDITIADANDNVGWTVTNNNTTNNPVSAIITNATIGKGLFIDQNGNGYALDIDKENTATIGAVEYSLKNSLVSSAVVTGTNQYLYGQKNYVTKTGADTNADTTQVVGISTAASNTGSTDAGTKQTYGGWFSAAGDTAGTSVSYGVYSASTGSDTNYSFYGETGTLYNVGAATIGGALTADTLTLTDHICVKRIPATNARVGSTSPTPITIENTRGLGFDADAEIAFITEPVPTGWNGTSDLALITAFCGTAGDAIANGEKVTLDISFNSIAEGEAVDNGTEKLATATHTSTGDTDKELILLSITIDHDNADQPLTAGDALFIKFNRDVTAEAGNTYSGAAIVQRWALQYTSDQPCP